MAGTPMPARKPGGQPSHLEVDAPAWSAKLGHAELKQYGRLSAISGIVFAVLFVTALVLVELAPGLGAPDDAYTSFYASGGGSLLVAVGLYIAPLAGIAFLWHMAALRALFGGSGEALSTVPNGLQFASGIAFVCMIFAGTALAGSIAVLDMMYSTDPLPPPEVARALNGAAYLIVFIFGVRFVAMYMITTTVLARAAGVLPRWLAIIGYLMAAVLLVSTTNHPAILLVLPAWMVVVNVVVVMRTSREPGSEEGRRASQLARSGTASDPTTSTERKETQ
jgi:hypothetical protein